MPNKNDDKIKPQYGFTDPEVQARAVEAARKAGGRGPGKANKEIRERIKEFVEGNMDKFQEWIDRLAVKDPGAALDKVTKLIEYTTPKQQHIKTEQIKDIIRIHEKRNYEDAETIEAEPSEDA
jgi:hypothetical protein